MRDHHTRGPHGTRSSSPSGLTCGTCAHRWWRDPHAGAIRFRVPEWGLLDLAAVDAILISNAQNMLALPFITEHSAFRGRVYATEPTVQIARCAFAIQPTHPLRSLTPPTRARCVG